MDEAIGELASPCSSALMKVKIRNSLPIRSRLPTDTSLLAEATPLTSTELPIEDASRFDFSNRTPSTTVIGFRDFSVHSVDLALADAKAGTSGHTTQNPPIFAKGKAIAV